MNNINAFSVSSPPFPYHLKSLEKHVILIFGNVSQCSVSGAEHGHRWTSCKQQNYPVSHTKKKQTRNPAAYYNIHTVVSSSLAMMQAFYSMLE